MIASNEEPSQIIILTEFLVYLSVLVFHVYRYIWQPKIKEILEMHIGPEEKSAVAVIDKEGCIIEHLPKAWTYKGTGGKYAKTIFFFFTFWWAEYLFTRSYWKSGEHGRCEGYDGHLQAKFQNYWHNKEYYLLKIFLEKCDRCV